MRSIQSISETSLWKQAFGNSEDPSESAQLLRARFQTALVSMREKVAELVQEIRRDMPDLTVHDVTHLDSLWEIGSLIVAESHAINPAEAFVLGGAFLVHDAALCIAAYPNRLLDLVDTPEWRDCATIEYRKLGIDRPDKSQIQNPNNHIRTSVLWKVLRVLHSKSAEKLPSQKWVWKGKEAFLIDDSELRTAYSSLIGTIAASHHWSVPRVVTHLNKIRGAFPNGPSDWKVDPLKLACILRLADACHVDSRRAPLFRYLVTKPEGVSALHWNFQQKLLAPHVEGEDLIFTSSDAFSPHEADSWWICYEWMCMVAREIHDVDVALEENARTRFRCRNVRGMASPTTFAAYVAVEGWEPIESSVRISNVPALVKRLGGSALYGNKPQIALRELVQNAADAIRAREAYVPGYRGSVRVQLHRESDEAWLVVQDDGIGMSQHTITSALLDFGNSFWHSEGILDELPGLVASGFQAGGRFGIGFFSIFMLGDHVTVTSRKYDKGYDSTRRLEFRCGLKLRPILLHDDGTSLPIGGTQVKVRLSSEALEAMTRSGKLTTLVGRLFPALEVSIFVQQDGNEPELAVRGGDWETIDAASLLARAGIRVTAQEYPLTMLEHDGRVCGRAGVFHHGASNQDGVIVDNQGIAISSSRFFTGIIRGVPTNVTRSAASLQLDKQSLSRWATEQADILTPQIMQHSEKIYAATQILCAGGNLGSMPFLTCRGQLVNSCEFKDMIRGIERFYLFFESYFGNDLGENAHEPAEWREWYQENLVFRAAPFFSNRQEDVLQISGIVRENVWKNPITASVRQLAMEAWNLGLQEGTDRKTPPARRGERLEVSTILSFTKLK